MLVLVVGNFRRKSEMNQSYFECLWMDCCLCWVVFFLIQDIHFGSKLNRLLFGGVCFVAVLLTQSGGSPGSVTVISFFFGGPLYL